MHLLTHSILNLLSNEQYLHQRNVVDDKIVSRSFLNKQVVLRFLKYCLFMIIGSTREWQTVVKPVS